MPPSTVHSWRQALGKTLSSSYRGRCLDTLLQLELGDKDPIIAQLWRSVEAWIQIITAGARERALALRDWPKHLESSREKPAHRWRRTTGPARAVINSLLDVGWNPSGPWDWTSDTGERFLATEEILSSGVFDLADLQQELANTVRRRIWRKASRHYESEDVAGGLYLEDVRQQLRAARAADRFPWAGALLTVAAGGQWPRHRIKEVCDPPD